MKIHMKKKMGSKKKKKLMQSRKPPSPFPPHFTRRENYRHFSRENYHSVSMTTHPSGRNIKSTLLLIELVFWAFQLSLVSS